MKATNKELLTDVLNYIRFSKYCIIDKKNLAIVDDNKKFKIIIQGKSSQDLCKQLKKSILSEVQCNSISFDRLQSYNYDKARVSQLLGL